MKVVIDLSKEDLRIICERTKNEIWEEYGGVDQRLMEAVQNGKIISEMKGEQMKHELKILPKWYEDVKHQKKNFEIRRADRDFKVGDTLILKEYEKGRYTGREIERTIQYIYKGDGTYGLPEEFWILGLKTVEGE